jgi:hypothetical protein
LYSFREQYLLWFLTHDRESARSANPYATQEPIAMAAYSIVIAWTDADCYSIPTQPPSTGVKMGDTLNISPPADHACTVSFSPSLPVVGTSSPVYASWPFDSGQMKAFTFPTESSDYTFNFSVSGAGCTTIDGRSVPINKT